MPRPTEAAKLRLPIILYSAVAGEPRVAGGGGGTVPENGGIFGQSGEVEENHSAD